MNSLIAVSILSFSLSSFAAETAAKTAPLLKGECPATAKDDILKSALKLWQAAMKRNLATAKMIRTAEKEKWTIENLIVEYAKIILQDMQDFKDKENHSDRYFEIEEKYPGCKDYLDNLNKEK